MRPPKPTVGNAISPTALKQADVHVVPQSQVLRGRVDMQPEKFTRMLQQKGYPLIWTKALLCPCVSPESDQARVDCANCDSSGFIYVEPIEIQAHINGLEAKKGIYRNLGEWLTGLATVSVGGDIRLGYMDRLAMTHSIMGYNEWIKKGNRRGVRSTLPPNRDACRYKIVRMMHLVWEPVENEPPVMLEQGIDFKITEEGWVEWLKARSIPDGTVFTAHYEFHPIWVVVTNPHVVRDTVTRTHEPAPTARSLPLTAAVKLDYLIDSRTLVAGRRGKEVVGAPG